jgi:hypothetical protein
LGRLYNLRTTVRYRGCGNTDFFGFTFPAEAGPRDRSHSGGQGFGHTGGHMGSGVPKAIRVLLSSTEADG